MKNILVVGSLGYDTIATPSGRVENITGGSANYFSLAAALYSQVRLVGVIGQDYRQEDLQVLKSREIDVTGLKTEAGETFRWSGSYVEDLNEAVTLKTELNVFQNFNPILPDAYKKSDFVFLANIDPVLQMRVLDQVQHPQVVGLDTMNYWIDSKLSELKSALKRVDVLLINETETRKLTGIKNIVRATRELSQLGPRTVVVKRGEYGFFMYSHEKYFVLPAYPVSDVIDPTGAGDSFAGGFFGYLSQCADPTEYEQLQRACVHGAVVASFCVQDFGNRALVRLNWAEVEERIAAYTHVVTFSTSEAALKSR